MVTGAFDGERVALDVVHRFANRPVRLPGGLHWDLLGLYRGVGMPWQSVTACVSAARP